MNTHPDREWLLQTIGNNNWAIAGTLSFRHQQHTVNHSLLKQYFAQLNQHLYGSLAWKNVPFIARWGYDNKDFRGERLHVHFTLQKQLLQFHWLNGTQNQFTSPEKLCQWLMTHWTHGDALINPLRNETAWLLYLTRTNDSIWDTIYSPSMHWLKKHVSKQNEESMKTTTNKMRNASADKMVERIISQLQKANVRIETVENFNTIYTNAKPTKYFN